MTKDDDQDRGRHRRHDPHERAGAHPSHGGSNSGAGTTVHRRHTARTDPFRALRNRNYRLFAAGFLCGSTGLQMLAAAVLWEIWQRTHDPLWLGYSGLARAAPVILLSLPAGHLADIVSRRAVVLVTQSLFTLIALLFALSAWFVGPNWLLLALLFLSGVVRAFNGPARASLLPLLVPRPRFENAVTWNGAIFQFAALAGPLIAAGMIATIGGTASVYATSAVLCSIFAGATLFLKPRREPHSGARFTPRSMLAGMGHIVREKTIFGAITLDMLAVLFGGATALLPYFADEVLGAGAIGYGLLRAAPNIGAIAMALALTAKPKLSPAGPMLLGSVVIFGLTIIGFGLSTSLALSIILLAIGGAADNVSVIIRHVLVQARTPNALRGRVSAVNTVFIECSNELGAFESGLVAAWFTPVISVISGGVGTIVVVGAVALLFPALRRLQDLRQVDPALDSVAAPVGTTTGR